MNIEKYIERTKQTSINITNTHVDAIRTKDITRTGYRVYENGFVGVAGAIGEVDELALKEEAIQNLSLKIPYTVPLSSHLTLHRNDSQDDTTAPKLLEDLEEVLAVLRKTYPNFILSDKVWVEENEIKLINDLGLDLSYTTKQYGFNLMAREDTSINVLDTGICGESKIWDKNTILKEADNMFPAYGNLLELPHEQNFPVIFLGDDCITVLSKFLSELEGDKVGTQASLFTHMIGEQKFNPNFTLYQDRTSDKNVPFFDAEGTVSPDFMTPLIEGGKILQAYTDKQTATKYTLPLTGSADCTYDGVPTLSSPPVTVKSCGQTLKELLGGKLGLAIIMSAGGDYTPDGKFASPVQLAMLTDGEKFLGRVPEFEISGDLFELFGKDFIGASSDKPFFSMHALALNMKIN